MKIEPKIYFTYKLKSGRTNYLKNPSPRRLGAKLASDKFKKLIVEGHLKVVYGKAKCVQGCICVFDNEIKGNLQDIKWGLNAFMDKDLWTESGVNK